MRRLIAIPCGRSSLAASIDEGDRAVGLLIVAGGTELRSGAHGGLASLAKRVAAQGYPTLRFDRRGVGDSDGPDPGFEGAGPDIAAAAAALRRFAPHVRTLVGFGLCDGATALALSGERFDRLVLANPWVVVPATGLPPPAAIRRHYAEQLRDPAAWQRLLGGAIDFRKAARGLLAAAAPARQDMLADRVRAALGGCPATALLATRDATALAFADAHARAPFPGVGIERLASAAHSFAPAADRAWLAQKVLAILADVETAGA